MIKDFVDYKYDFNKILKSDVIFVWLSYKLDKNDEVLEAFSETTNSWKIISQLEELFWKIKIYKTNLVKWVPLINWKIIYPNTLEKEQWLEILLKEIDIVSPKVIYLFWREVSDFVIKKLDLIKYSNNVYYKWKIKIVIANHPSYIYIYKKNEIKTYMENLIRELK